MVVSQYLPPMLKLVVSDTHADPSVSSVDDSESLD